ncbi:putative MFS family arabinose efflux permease [Rathayibacter sp. PhB151]|uniref:MFS transporter n=1 Tax=Rathayibacter sp. PhB151 TaxID=2485189 RepID=UPI0010644DFC|nr:MFS transporter [Rathayibacter sp. PhB151]TDX82280.1 putative MFS family arabinose efflux permease [Rathayibacter sp. PhB151]
MTTARESVRKILRANPDYRRVFLAQIVSQGGDWFTMIPLIVLLQRLTGDGALGALLLAAETAVVAVLSLWAGGLVDRLSRRTVLVVAQAGSALAVLPLFLLQSAATAWLAVLTFGLLAAGKAFFTPAVNAIVPQIVPRESLLVASTGLNSVWGVMLALGASLGGIASALVSPYFCFAITAVAYGFSALLLLGLPAARGAGQGAGREAGRRGGAARFARDVREVAAFCRSDRRIPALLLAKPGSHLGNGAIALFPALALTMAADPAVAASLLFAARGVGAVIGPRVARFAAERSPDLRGGIVGAVLLFGLGYALVSISTSVVLAIALVLLAHIGGSMNASLSGYGLQSITANDLRGRVFAVDNMIAMLAIALSQALVSLGILLLEPRTVMALCSAVVLGCAALWWSATRRTPLRTA